MALGRAKEQAGGLGSREDAELDTLRLLLVKVGGRVRKLLTRVKVHLASGHPAQRLWQALSKMVHE